MSRNVLREVANHYHHWAEHSAQKWGVEIVDDPKGRRDGSRKALLGKGAARPGGASIVKAREPAGVMTAIDAGKKWHLETKYRWVKQYNFYIQDADRAPIFVRVCPYFPFSTRICLQPALLARRENEASGDSLLPKAGMPFAAVVIPRLSRRVSLIP